MSAAAVAKLQQLWEKLTFARIQRVIAREPEDVCSIRVLNSCGNTDYVVHSRRTKDIPEVDLPRARVTWRHYFGFAEGVYFQRADYCELDLDISFTCDFGLWGNHQGGYMKPEVGTLIAGVMTHGRRGPRFQKWFVCSPALKCLIESVLHGTNLSEEELGRKLLASGYPDMYWAIARLVLFDNVKVFVDQYQAQQECRTWTLPQHPAHGMFTGTVTLRGERLTVDHPGMWLSKSVVEFVHLLSWKLNEPQWWEAFQRLAFERGLDLCHHIHGGRWCEACAAEEQQRSDWEDTCLVDEMYA